MMVIYTRGNAVWNESMLEERVIWYADPIKIVDVTLMLSNCICYEGREGRMPQVNSREKREVDVKA